MLVSIILPAYKHEKIIDKNIADIYSAMTKTRWKFEIIVVVDGLCDNTLSNATKSRLNFPSTSRSKIKVLGYPTKKGRGYAIRYGMARAKGDYIAFIDAGMEIDANGISLLLEQMEWQKADIAVGSKTHPLSKVNYPFYRKVCSYLYKKAISIFLNMPAIDTQVGLKAFKRKVLEKVLPRLVIKQYACDVELLAIAYQLGFTNIVESPVSIKFSWGKKDLREVLLFQNKGIRDVLIDTLGIIYRLRILKYYDDKSRQKWVYDKELAMRINTGELADKSKGKSETKIKFSVIIPVRAINSFLEENISYLKQQVFKQFEVIIVTDEPESFNFRDERFKIIHSGEISPGAKKNMGAKAAKGEILVFLDDDAYPTNNWLKEAELIFRDREVYALGAPAVTPEHSDFLERCAGRVLTSALTSADTLFRHIPLSKREIKDYPSVNLFVRRRAFFSVGGYSKGIWPGEDTKLCLDLIKKYKKPFLYDPNPVVYHHRRKLFNPYLKQISRYGEQRGYFAKVYPETSRLMSYFVPSLFTLGLFVGPIICLFIPQLWYVYFGILAAYIALVSREIVKVLISERNIRAAIYVGVGIVLTHIVYGMNFIKGLLHVPSLKLKKYDKESGNYTEG